MIAAYVPLLLGLAAGAVWDARKREIPNFVSLLLLCSGVLAIAVYHQSWLDRIVGSLLTGVVMLVVSLTAGGLGGGDIKQCSCLVLAMGLIAGLYAILYAFLLAGIVLLVRKARKMGKDSVPMAVFLALGSCISLAMGYL